MDWRKIEQVIVDFLEREGPGKPKKVIGFESTRDEPFTGDWILPYGKGKLNISALAREIAIDMECK